jgi:hypothetical protein
MMRCVARGRERRGRDELTRPRRRSPAAGARRRRRTGGDKLDRRRRKTGDGERWR